MALLRVGLIGLGVMGSAHARYINESVEGAQVVALADTDAGRVSELAKELGGVISLFTEADLFFAEAQVDAFVIASPDSLHVPHLRLALKRGLPTLCEKPIAPSVSEARQIAGQIRGVQSELGAEFIHFGFMRRFDPSYLEVKHLLDSGEFGEALFVRSSTRNVESVGITTEGLLSNIAVHDFDILRWLFSSEWASVSISYPRSSSLSPDGLADPIMFTAKLENGILVSADIVANNNYGYDVRTEFVCERGSIEIGIHGDVITRTKHFAGVSKGGVMDDNWIPKFTPAYINELQSWVHGIQQGNPHPDLATVEDALMAAEAVSLGLLGLSQKN